VLEQFHVTRVEAVGKPFDPNVHEAVMHVERNEDEPGTVAEEFQKGYLLDGRLLRPSMVSVVKGPESE
jgi:molecular chaperone GrpE